jgi:hypothetical protein
MANNLFSDANWGFEFIQLPKVVKPEEIEPLKKLLKERFISVAPEFIEGKSHGSITLKYTDKDDQTISKFIDGWGETLCSRENRSAFRKEDTIAEGELTDLSSKPIRTYKLFSLQPTNIDISQPYQCTLTLRFEHCEKLE